MSRNRSLGLRLLLLLTVCAVAGGTLAGMVLPAVGGLGLAAKSVADRFDNLPDSLVEPALAQRTELFDSSGHVLAQLHGAEDRVVIASPDQIPDVMKRAIVAIEDSRFYEHHGVDFQGVLRAVVRNGQAGTTEQGASTITQQYVKNVLIEAAHSDAERKAAIADTTQRKLQEARYALEIEQKYSKDEILRRYLNIADFGDGVYGVGTAAQHYFRIPLAKINLAQAALLAGIVNSPSRFDPFANPVAARDRRDIVLDRMVSTGLVDATDAATARQVAMPTRKASKAPADACESTEAPFFCFYVRSVLQNDKALGETPDERNRAVFDGGLQVRTTLDMNVQKAAQQAVDAIIPESDHVTAVVAVVQPGTGKVLAIAANRIYSSKSGVGHTKLGYLGYQPIFQGGSTFKLFTLAAALSGGIPLHTTISAPPCYHPDPLQYPDLPSTTSCKAGYQNSDDSEAGTFDLVSGTWYSVNTFFIQLEEKVGVDNVIKAAEAMGVSKAAFKQLGKTSLSVTLGAVDGVSPIEEASAYATVAAHGVTCNPSPVESVQSASKQKITLNLKANCHEALTPEVADTISGILQGVLTQPGATAAGKGLAGRVAAGKTGTLDEEKAAWFTGFTPQLSTAVVLGDPSAPSHPLGVVEGVYPVFGGTLPATIWQRTMNAALADKPALPMPAPVYGAVVHPAAPAVRAAPAAPAKSGKSSSGKTKTKTDTAPKATAPKKP